MVTLIIALRWGSKHINIFSISLFDSKVWNKSLLQTSKLLVNTDTLYRCGIFMIVPTLASSELLLNKQILHYNFKDYKSYYIIQSYSKNGNISRVLCLCYWITPLKLVEINFFIATQTVKLMFFLFSCLLTFVKTLENNKSNALATHQLIDQSSR